MLDIWPSYVQSIMKECLQNPTDRPAFCDLQGYLLGIRNSGEGLTSEVLDGAFSYWQEVQSGAIYSEIRLCSGLSKARTRRSSSINVMRRRSSSATQWHGRRRSTSVKGGLTNILKVLSNRAQGSPKEREIDRFGYEIAERLAYVRHIRRHARNYDRAGWAKEVVLTRVLEGDIERIKKEEKKAKSSKEKRKQLSRRGRRYSVFDEEGFERLQMISSKYKKKNWSKILHGMEKLKNSMEGFKGQVFQELNVHGYERKPLAERYSVPEHSKRCDDFGEVNKTIKQNIERAGSRPEDKYNYKIDTSNAGTSDDGAEFLYSLHSKGSPLPIYTHYAQSNKKKRTKKEGSNCELQAENSEDGNRETTGKIRLDETDLTTIRSQLRKTLLKKTPSQETSGIERLNETSLKMIRSQLRKTPVEKPTSGRNNDMTATVRGEADSSNQEKPKMSDSDIHGSSSHGMYAISDFLRQTDSFRKERLEMIASRSQNNSTVSAIVSNSSEEKINSRPRAQSARQPRRKSRSRTASSGKEGNNGTDKEVSQMVNTDNSPHHWGVRFDRSHGQSTSRLRSNSEEVSDIIKSSQIHLDNSGGESSS